MEGSGMNEAVAWTGVTGCTAEARFTNGMTPVEPKPFGHHMTGRAIWLTIPASFR